MTDPADLPADAANRAPSIERGVEGEEERFYSRSEPGSAAPLPPDPGTTPAELEPAELDEETGAAGSGEPLPPYRP